jgi:hypothetical protein
MASEYSIYAISVLNFFVDVARVEFSSHNFNKRNPEVVPHFLDLDLV